MNWRRIWHWVSMILLGVLAIPQLVLLIWINPIFERSIREGVPFVTDGLYQVDSLDITFGIFTQSLKIENLELVIDSTLINTVQLQDESPFLSRLHVPEINIKFLDIVRLLKKEEIYLERIYLFQPEIKLSYPSSLSTSDSSQTSLEINDLYKLIYPRIKGVYIDEFHIDRGKLQVGDRFESNHFNAKEVSLKLENIQVDSTSFERSNRPLYADYLDFSVDVTDYTVVLPDSNYQIRAKNLGYATGEERLWIEQLEIHPYPEFEVANLQDKPLNIILKIPYLELKGFRPGEIFFDRVAMLDSISVKTPTVLLSGIASTGGVSELPEFESPNDLFRYVSPYLNRFETKGLMVHNAKVVSSLRINDQPLFASIDSFSANFYSMAIDESSTYLNDRILCSEEINFAVKHFTTDLPDSSERIHLKSLSYSTEGKRFQLHKLQTSSLKTDVSRALEADIPDLFITGIDVSQWWNTGKLYLDSLWLEKPTFDFTLRKRLINGESRDQERITPPDTLLPYWLDTFQIQHVGISKGNIVLGDSSTLPYNNVNIDSLNFDIQNLRFTKGRWKNWKELLANNNIAYSFQMGKHDWTLPDSSYFIQTQRVNVSSDEEYIMAEKSCMMPGRYDREDTTLFEINVPLMIIRGWDPLKILIEKELNIQSMYFLQPDISVIQMYDRTSNSSLDLASIDLYKSLKDQFEVVHLDSLLLEDATIIQSDTYSPSFQLPHLSVQAVNFHVDSTTYMDADQLFYTDNIEFAINDYVYLLPDSLHEITLDYIHYSTFEKDLRLDSIRLYPIADALKKDNWNLGVRGIDIEGINVYEILTEGKAHLSRLHVDEPDLSFEPLRIASFKPGEGDSLPGIDLYSIISPFISELSLDRLSLSEGAFTLLGTGNVTQQENLEVRDIFVDIEGLQVDSMSDARTGKPFYADNIAVNIDVNKYAVTLPDSSYRIEFRDIGLSTSDSIFYADSLRLEPLLASRKDPVQVELVLDRIQLDGVNITQLYFDQEVDLSGLKLFKPNILLTINQRPQREDIQSEGLNQKDFISKDPYPRMSELFSFIDIEDVAIEDGRFVLTGSDINTIAIKDFSFYAFDFRLDEQSYSQLDQTYLFAKDFAIIVNDYEIPLPDTSMYRLKTAKFGIFSRNESFFIDSLQVIPKYGKYSFAAQKGYIMDRWDVFIPRVDVRKLNMDKLYRQTSLEAEELNVFLPEIRIYKDKRLPFPDWKRPPMPWKAIQESSTSIHLDTVRVYDGYVFYEERNPDTDTVAWFELAKTDLTIYPITNNPYWILQHPDGVVQMQAKIMDVAPVNTTITFPWKDTSHVHSFEGTVGSLPASHLNPILENTGFISVSSGNIHKARFRFTADKHKSNGRMRLYYNDLKVNLLSKNLERDQGILQKVGSGFANAFVVRKDNPRRFLRVGHIEFEREEEKAVLVFWIKSILSGLMSSVGIKSKEMKLKDY